MNSSLPQPDTIITGHGNADFDCFSSIIAAGKLYPGAALIFPGSQEKPLRSFYMQSAMYAFNFLPARNLQPEYVKRLVVVDTRQRSRLSHVAAILDRTDVVVHAYDHHPDSADDITADMLVWKPWGSCAAIISQQIMDAGQSLSPEEATAIALGLYEDTGSFTFPSTTEHDLAVAAWLRRQGMDLETVSELITHEMTAQQVSILNALIESATRHDINGREIVVAEAETDHYVGDFAMLAHKFMDMENPRVLFALGRMGDRIQLVARSRDDAVNVATVCERLGGGGHAYAASASIKDRTLAQVKDEIFAQLYGQIHTRLTVGTVTSRPAVAIDKTSTIGQAAEIMTRYGFKALPVVGPGGSPVVGIIEHDIADKALAHGLADVQVREYMQRDITTATPDEGFDKVMSIILGRGHGPRQHLVPVIEDDKLVGVVSRTDVVNLLIEEPARIPEALYPDKQRKKSIAGPLREKLPPTMRQIIAAAGALGEKLGVEVFAVGGFVRDLLLGRPNMDLDLVVEGDGVAFAQDLAKELSGRMKAHPKFKTAVVILEGNLRVDVATARLEYYERPAALPIVELSSIKMDLYRRDFSVNALAVHLNPPRFGLLEDFFGGHKDIKEGVIRVLHSLSFVEDPTRILRAIRFEQRFGFHIGGQTERLLKNALQLTIFQRLSGSRIFHELTLILNEEHPVRCLERMEEFGLPKLIHPILELKGKPKGLLDELERVRDWHRLLYQDPAAQAWKLFLLGLSDGAPQESVHELLLNLGFSSRMAAQFAMERRAVMQAQQQLMVWRKQLKRIENAPQEDPGHLSAAAEPFARLARQPESEGKSSDLAAILRGLPVEGILLLMAKATREPVRKAISIYLTRLRHLTIEVTGADLQAMGLTPGPSYTTILRTIMAAKIDGYADCRQEQLALARKLIHNLAGETGPQKKQTGPLTADYRAAEAADLDDSPSAVPSGIVIHPQGD